VKIRIEADTRTISGTRVWLDDVQQSDLTGVEFRHLVGDIARLRLDRFSHRQPFLRRFSEGLRFMVREMKAAMRA
jgi:hypothetical protein